MLTGKESGDLSLISSTDWCFVMISMSESALWPNQPAVKFPVDTGGCADVKNVCSFVLCPHTSS